MQRGRRASSPSRTRRGSSPRRSSVTTKKKERNGGAVPLPVARSPSTAHSFCADSASIPSRMSRVKAGRRSSTSHMTSVRSSATEGSFGELSNSSSHGAGKKGGNRRGAVSPFLRSTHKELKGKITEIQEQIRFIQDLATMNDSQKVQILFRRIDKDGGGSVDATELAEAMRQNDELSFSDSIDKAIDMVAKHDADGDGELDISEFEAYVFGMVNTLGMTCSEFCELIIVQLLLSAGNGTVDEDQATALSEEKIETEIKKRRTVFAFVSDPRVVALFEMFAYNDESPVEEVPFEAVARACKRSPVTRGAKPSDREALELLLMTSKNDDRVLDLKQFGRLILSLLKMARTNFEDLAESLIDGPNGDHSGSVDTSISGSCQGDHSSQVDSFTYRRLKKLFRIWDVDRDGDISATELSNGLGMFQKATGIKADAKAIADALIAFDEDGDGELDPREFSEAMVHYAKIQQVDLNLLIDFMCMVSANAPQEPTQESNQDAERSDSSDGYGYEIDMWMD